MLCHVLQQGRHVQRSTEVSRQRLDVAILSFLDSFRAAYIAENRMAASKVGVAQMESIEWYCAVAVVRADVRKLGRQFSGAQKRTVAGTDRGQNCVESSILCVGTHSHHSLSSSI